MRSSKREKRQPRRFDDEEPESPMIKKRKKKKPTSSNSKPTQSSNDSNNAIKSNAKTKAPKPPAKKESITSTRKTKSTGKANSNIRKTKQGNTYVVKPKTQPIIDVSSTEILICTATASQITKASKKKYRPTKAEKNQLIQIPSHQNRAKIYLHAAKAISRKEAAALPSHGARPWFCHVTVSDEQGATASSSNYDDDFYEVKKGKKGKMSSSPLFVWNKYHLELAVLPHILDNIDEIDTSHGLLKAVKEEVKQMEELDDGYVTDEEEYIKNLMERPVSVLSTVAYNDSSYVIPTLERKWTSPDLVTFRSRSKAVEHSLMLLDRDKLIDRVMHGIGSRGSLLRAAKPTRKLSIEAGYFRFIRDGLWVVGQEEDWIEERIRVLNEQEEEEGKLAEEQKRVLCGQQCESTIENQEAVTISMEMRHENDCKEDSKSEDDSDLVKMNTEKDCEKAVAANSDPVEVSNEEDCTSTEDLSSPDHKSEKSEEPEHSSACSDEQKDTNSDSKMGENIQNVIKDDEESSSDTARISPEAANDVGSIIISSSGVKQKGTNSDPNVGEKIRNVIKDTDKESSKVKKLSRSFVSPEESNNNTVGSMVLSIEISCDPKANSPKKSKITKPKRERKLHTFVPSMHWRLTPEQVTKCYNAVIDHYDKVMYTVKAKALYPELADGFDVFRERGRGRFDMTLEAFDTPEFSFLTDLNTAAWMPVVKKILGDDATLVHKGAFLSTPGAQTQVYHQDGLHLNKKYQKPCHAINVFIPLVDLNMKNGPTEFCLGTHHLGYEAFNKDLIDIPLAPAGSPVIFDYRLGHRGLGNNSREPRPIVYLTYTRASREFRDAVNFSSKRYRKLGELIEKPMSRQERALKRVRDL